MLHYVHIITLCYVHINIYIQNVIPGIMLSNIYKWSYMWKNKYGWQMQVFVPVI